MTEQDAVQEREGYSFKKEFFDICETIVFSLVVLILIFLFIFRVVGVEGDSMEYTLSTGDRLIVSHLFYDPKPGDIVVVELDEYFDTPIIKRVIAVGGQTVDIDSETGKVRVDGQELDEPYTHDPTTPKSLHYPMTVPEGSVFVMGDNRVNSTDGRNFGYVDKKHILGKAIFRIFPVTKIGVLS